VTIQVKHDDRLSRHVADEEAFVFAVVSVGPGIEV
jgi:hypothetical protein